MSNQGIFSWDSLKEPVFRPGYRGRKKKIEFLPFLAHSSIQFAMTFSSLVFSHLVPHFIKCYTQPTAAPQWAQNVTAVSPKDVGQGK